MVNINGLPEINGENYPLDIWSLYMQNAVQKFPEQEFDVPSPSMNLEIKTDGRAVAPVETTEETDRETTAGEGGSEDSSPEPVNPEPLNPNPNRPAPAAPAAQSAQQPAGAGAPPGDGF
jgi:penicillin-binding protein 1A